MERGNLEDLNVDVDWRIILNWIFKKCEAWSGLIWFTIGAGGGHL
jgi:hypothetical protein